MARNSARLALTVVGILAAFLLQAASPPAFAQSLEQQIDTALKPKASLTRGLSGSTRPVEDNKSAEQRQFIDHLRTRSIVVEPTEPAAQEERAKVIEIVKEKPAIDLEIYFDYNSAVVGPKAMPTLYALGSVLSKPEYRSTVFFINGYTDASGNAEYNLILSQRRAAAVKAVLIELFKLSPDTLIAYGFGKEQLKIPQQPYADENRRVQIVNTEQKATVSRQ